MVALVPELEDEIRGELKYKGRSHDVTENKGKSKRQFGWSHDVCENKRLNFLKPRYV
jgi:hypothetical protein